MNLATVSSRTAVLALTLLSATGCFGNPADLEGNEVSEQEQGIYNGELVTSGPLDGPASRVMQVTSYNGRERQICTGVLISSRWVLTAAHCVADALPGFVWASSPWGYTSGVVARTIMHKGFRYNDEQAAGASELMPYAVADLALIELDTSASPVDTFVKPLTLYNQDPAPGQTVTCYGFGYGDRSNTETNSPLRKASLQVGSLTYEWGDANSFRLGFTVERNGLGQDISKGDSGGPCFIGDGASAMLVGISSSATLVGPYRVDIYADITQPSQYIGWLEPIVRDEITSLRMTYGLGRLRLDLTNAAANNNTIRTPKWVCLGQRSCAYPLDWQDPSISSGTGAVTLTWQCGRDATVHSVAAAAPLAGQTLNASCVTMKWTGPIVHLPQ